MDWLDPAKLKDHHGFLWINGKPGAGKSTLMKFLVHRMEMTSSREPTVSFFFNARGGDMEKTTVGMYRSLLYQLLVKLPDLQTILDDSNFDLHGQSADIEWHPNLLRRLFSNAVAKLGKRRLYCFIDALDECDPKEVAEMVDDFENFEQCALETGVQLYICFSSRPYPFIYVQYGRRLSLELQYGHAEDMETYVQSKLKIGTTEGTADVKAKILEKADGVFMWVFLVVGILNQEYNAGQLLAVNKRLETIPPKLSELFQDILSRDQQDMDTLLLCIQWILFAEHPLTPEEFYLAVLAGLKNLDEEATFQLENDRIFRFVLNYSKGLAEITTSKDQRVQFIHESVRDYLLKDGGLRHFWPDLAENFESSSHDRLKECCFVYLDHIRSIFRSERESDGTTELRPIVERVLSPWEPDIPKAKSEEAKKLRQLVSSKMPFLQYATQNVLYHANAAALGVSQDTFLERFPASEWICWNNLFEIHQNHRYDWLSSILYIFADRNLAVLIRTMCQQGWTTLTFGDRYNRYKYPIYAAFAQGHRESARELLRTKEGSLPSNDVLARLRYGPNFTHATTIGRLYPIFWALDFDHTTIAVNWIVPGESEINIPDVFGYTLLTLAVMYGQVDVVEALLDRDDIDVNAKGRQGRTALYWAMNFGLHWCRHQDEVKYELQNLARVRYWKRIRDARLVAAHQSLNSRKRITMVRLLLSKGKISVNNTTIEGRTLLSHAVFHGNAPVVAALLKVDNIDVNGSEFSLSPLWLALQNEQFDILQLLYDSGKVDFNEKGDEGITSLNWARAHGSASVITFLESLPNQESAATSQRSHHRTPGRPTS